MFQFIVQLTNLIKLYDRLIKHYIYNFFFLFIAFMDESNDDLFFFTVKLMINIDMSDEHEDNIILISDQ